MNTQRRDTTGPHQTLLLKFFDSIIFLSPRTPFSLSDPNEKDYNRNFFDFYFIGKLGTVRSRDLTPKYQSNLTSGGSLG